MNLENHRVVDLLPDREAATAAQWMREHPDIAVVSRDRGTAYASAASEAVPHAVQCADRFHIVKNLTEATQLLLARCQAEILAAHPLGASPVVSQKQALSIQEWRPPEPAHVEKARLARRSGRYVRYQQVVALHGQGMKTQEIAKRLDISDRTVRDWLKHGSFPEARSRRKRQSSFDLFASYVLLRWQAGERNGLVLWREIKEQGYTGSNRSVYRYLKTLKLTEVKAEVSLHRLKKFSANTVVWLFIRERTTLDDIEREDLVAFFHVSPTLKKAYDLIQEFLKLVRLRAGDLLDAWLTRVAESDLPELQSFAAGIEKDKDAVRAGLTLSNQQWHGRRPCDKVKASQTDDVWQS